MYKKSGLILILSVGLITQLFAGVPDRVLRGSAKSSKELERALRKAGKAEVIKRNTGGNNARNLIMTGERMRNVPSSTGMGAASGLREKEVKQAVSGYVNNATKTAESAGVKTNRQMSAPTNTPESIGEKMRQHAAASAAAEDPVRTYERIKARAAAGPKTDVTDEEFLQLYRDVKFMSKQSHFVSEKYGTQELWKVEHGIGNCFEKVVEARLAPVFEPLDEYMGTHFAYPAKGTALREAADRELAAFDARYPGFKEHAAKMQMMDFLAQQRDYLDGIRAAEPSAYAHPGVMQIYEFMPVVEKVLDIIPHLGQYGSLLGLSKEMYTELEDAIIFRSVGAPPVHNLTRQYSTLENYIRGPAIFEVPPEIEQVYVKSVYERLNVFVKSHKRFPYFSSEARDKMLNKDIDYSLTEEARLHLAVRRCLAFPNKTEELAALEELANKSRKSVGTKIHDLRLPRTTYDAVK